MASGHKNYSFDEFVEIMRRLLAPDGCPWDRQQSHESLKPFLIEEAYEVLESIDKKDVMALKEELGDLLLQIVFHAELARQKDEFDINDVLTGICQKLLRRHPHVFGNQKWKSPKEVLENWEELKLREKDQAPSEQKPIKSILDGIPRYLPALIRAHRVQDRAARVGFDWNNIEDVFEKVEEELNELKKAYQKSKDEKIKEEFGDLIFALVNLARFLSIQPEDSLRATIDKFIKRFRYIEEKSAELGCSLKAMTLEQMDNLWNQAKNNEL